MSDETRDDVLIRQCMKPSVRFLQIFGWFFIAFGVLVACGSIFWAPNLPFGTRIIIGAGYGLAGASYINMARYARALRVQTARLHKSEGRAAV